MRKSTAIRRFAASGTEQVRVLNRLDGRYRAGISKDAQVGLTAPQRWVPCKYFYDARGSEIFEEICRLPEYYPTRAEMSILKAAAPEIMNASASKDVVELGSGATAKIRILLDAAGKRNRRTIRYIPVDISESAIAGACEDLLASYPELAVLGIVADFTRQLDAIPAGRPLMICFLGGTIGNMEAGEAALFLRDIAGNLKPEDSLLMGFDLVKNRSVMEAAYNDSQGVTARFNKNILRVLNNELKADFDEGDFDHIAYFNETESRIEMHLVANKDVRVSIPSIGMKLEMRRGESIHTENSRKFTGAGIENMTQQAGLHVKEWYWDSNGWFSLVLMGLGGG